MKKLFVTMMMALSITLQSQTRQKEVRHLTEKEYTISYEGLSIKFEKLTANTANVYIAAEGDVLVDFRGQYVTDDSRPTHIKGTFVQEKGYWQKLPILKFDGFEGGSLELVVALSNSTFYNLELFSVANDKDFLINYILEIR